MVSCETHISFLSGEAFFNQPENCSGDQSAFRKSVTISLKVTFSASKSGLGRLARLRAILSAKHALYFRLPPLRVISREMLDGALQRSAAILRILRPLASPRDMDSRSSMVRLSGLFRLGRGSMPPWYNRYEKTVAGGLLISAAIKLIGCPCRHNSHILDLRSGVIGP